MQNPEPDIGWKPTGSTVGGSILGGAVGQIVVAICDQVFHTRLTAELSGAITTICIFAIGYLFPDGGRK